MVKCAVSGCPNRLVNYNRGVFNQPPRRFFRFPAEPARVKVWLAALRQMDEDDPVERRLICEDHFLPAHIRKNGVTSDAIPLMPPYLDGPLGLGGPRSSGEEDEQWPSRDCDDDEGGEEAPAAANPPQQAPDGRTEDSSASRGHRDESDEVTAPGVPLGPLTRRLLQLMLVAPEGRLDLQGAASTLQTPLQRVSDVVDVLDGISLVQRESTNRVKWIGWSPVSSFLWRNRSRFQRELDYLQLVEDAVDHIIRSCAQQLFHVTDDQEASPWAYVTLEDLSGLRGYWDQTLIIIRAPQETRLEIPSPEEDNIQVHLKAGKGPIMVRTCEVGSGDPPVFVTLEESRIRTTTLHPAVGSTEEPAGRVTTS